MNLTICQKYHRSANRINTSKSAKYVILLFHSTAMYLLHSFISFILTILNENETICASFFLLLFFVVAALDADCCFTLD